MEPRSVEKTDRAEQVRRLSALLGRIDRRSSENRRKRSLEHARSHLDFLGSWLELQEKLVDPEALEELRRSTSRELESLRRSVVELSAPEESSYRALRDRPVLQRALLAYRPLRSSGWYYRWPYYMLIGVCIAIAADGERATMITPRRIAALITSTGAA